MPGAPGRRRTGRALPPHPADRGVLPRGGPGRPGARPEAKLYAVKDIVGTTTGHTRSGHTRGIGLAHLSDERHGGPTVIPICVDWETGEVYAVVGLKPWTPD
jgi:hypothetical protein